jgi:hypothetical protein
VVVRVRVEVRASWRVVVTEAWEEREVRVVEVRVEVRARLSTCREQQEQVCLPRTMGQTSGRQRARLLL